jgi:hypothetical protein
MGDHPVIWTNEHVKARNIYIFMGHSPDLFENEAYKRYLLMLYSGPLPNHKPDQMKKTALQATAAAAEPVTK